MKTAIEMDLLVCALRRTWPCISHAFALLILAPRAITIAAKQSVFLHVLRPQFHKSSHLVSNLKLCAFHESFPISSVEKWLFWNHSHIFLNWLMWCFLVIHLNNCRIVSGRNNCNIRKNNGHVIDINGLIRCESRFQTTMLISGLNVNREPKLPAAPI